MASKARAIVTATYYTSPDDLRFGLALKTCAAAKEAGYPLFIVDGSPDPSIREALRNSGAIVYEQVEDGMGASRR
ncbi:MAG: hypothetical protein V4436_00290, partial [Patescibacteria group bacterium]